MLIASRSRFTALPADVQAAIRESVPAAITEGLAYYNRFREESFVEVRRRGINIIEPDLAPFKAAARPAYDTILGNAPNGRALPEIEAAKAALEDHPSRTARNSPSRSRARGRLCSSSRASAAPRASWSPLLPELARRHRVAVMDQRGIGASTRGTAPVNITTLAEDAAAVAHAMGGPVALCGHSTGAAIVLTMAEGMCEVSASCWGRLAQARPLSARALHHAARHPRTRGLRRL